MAKVLTDETALQLTEALLQNDKNIKNTLEKDMHSHDNKSVLDNVTSNKISEWDNKAEKSDIPDTKGFVTEYYVATMIANAQLSGGEVDLSGYYNKDETYSKSEVDEALKNVTVDLTGYATEDYVDTAIANAQLEGGEGSNVDLSNYATKTDLENYAEKNHEHKEYLTEHQDLSAYALKTEIPDTTSFAKKDELHAHDNVSVLSKISESATGTLLFNGEEIKGGSGGEKGADGKSAYEVAKDNGFSGTEEEWLESLKGKEGRSIKSITAGENNSIIATFTDGITKNLGQIKPNVEADFLTEEGFGKLRYYNGKFQCYDDATMTWNDTAVTSQNVCVVNMMPQSMKMFSATYDMELGYNKLRWEEPNDTIIDGQVTCAVEKVVVRRKLGSAPLNIEDGDLVIEVNRSQFGLYKDIYYYDEELTPEIGDVWYYKAFPISVTGHITTLDINEVIVRCEEYNIFGFRIDQTESDPASMITYLADNVGYKSAYMDYTAGTFNYGDWTVENGAWFMDIKPCMLRYDGTVDYYLDPNDYTKKEDGTASDIANTEYAGNAMVQIPKVYYKCVNISDDVAEYYFSDKKLDDDYHCWSHVDSEGNEMDYCYMACYQGGNVNNKLRSISNQMPICNSTGHLELQYALANNQLNHAIWCTEVFADRQLINLLLLLIGKSTNSQDIFGQGLCSSGYSSPTAGGSLNQKGLFYGSVDNTIAVKVFGIENWWGNAWRRIAGLIIDNGTQKVKLTYGLHDGSSVSGYNSTGDGYIALTGCTPYGTSGGYIKKMQFTKYGLIAVATGGSATTYYADALFYNNAQISCLVTGGRQGAAAYGGMLAQASDYNYDSERDALTTSISCKPLATV